MNPASGHEKATIPAAATPPSRWGAALFRALRTMGLGSLGLAAALSVKGATLSLDSLGASKNHVAADLISATAQPTAGQPFWVAIQLRMDSGWHTYWINPGDAGQTTTIKWDLPAGWTAGPIQWPTPQRLPLDKLMNYGYEGTAELLVQITPPRELAAGTKATLRAHVDWTECSAETCVPNSKDLVLELPQTSTAANGKSVIDDAMAHLPQPSATLNVSAWRSGNKLYLGLEPKSGAARPNLPSEAYFYSQDAQTQAAAPQTFHQTAAGWILELTRSEGAPSSAKSLTGVLTFAAVAATATGIPALAIEAPLGSGPPAALAADFNQISGAKDLAGLLALLGLGFIGGLILNVMPCVFPVLALKVLGFVKQAGAERRKVVLHGLVFTAGVLLSMWTLVGVLQFLRAAGSQLGWGFQLQEPAFVLGLVIFLLIFALSLSGVFEIGGSLIGLGGGLVAKDGLGGSFFQGVLAVVLATPCTAPILAPALGTALTLPAIQAFLAFTSIALGLAAPYLTLSLFPSLTRWLPRPGAWMETFKELMAFPLYATIGFLLYTLAGQFSGERFLNVLFALVLVALAAWIYGRYAVPSASTARRRFGQVAGLLILMSGVAFAYHPLQELNWEAWSPERVAELQKEGRPIYVDFTARWCATCQVDKDRVFGSQKVLDAVAKQNVALLKADWTNRDPRITAELARFNQSAVPLNLLYLPGNPEPEILPVFPLLTPEVVLDALAKDKK